MSILPPRTQAIFPASFDPITPAHLELINQATRIFDHVHVMVANNNSKKHLFQATDRTRTVARACQRIPNSHKVTVFESSNLVVNETRARGINFIIRGLRNQGDWEYEQRIQHMNTVLLGGLTPVYLTTSAELQVQSSSMYRELATLAPQIQEERLLKDFVDEKTLYLCILNSKNGIADLYMFITGQAGIPDYLQSHLSSFSKPNVYYHNPLHTSRVLRTMIEYGVTSQRHLLAAMYHDVRYSAKPEYDHELEACKAFELDNLHWAYPGLITSVKRLILSTRHTTLHTDLHPQTLYADLILLDADLEYLSDEPTKYTHQVLQIKKEFVPYMSNHGSETDIDRAWTLGRARWARGFLKKFPEIYHSKEFRELHTKQAVKNLQSDIERMRLNQKRDD